MMSITLLVVPSYHVYHPVISESMSEYFCHTIIIMGNCCKMSISPLKHNGLISQPIVIKVF